MIEIRALEGKSKRIQFKGFMRKILGIEVVTL
jgi:hypothetical protein